MTVSVSRSDRHFSRSADRAGRCILQSAAAAWLALALMLGGATVAPAAADSVGEETMSQPDALPSAASPRQTKARLLREAAPAADAEQEPLDRFAPAALDTNLLSDIDALMERKADVEARIEAVAAETEAVLVQHRAVMQERNEVGKALRSAEPAPDDEEAVALHERLKALLRETAEVRAEIDRRQKARPGYAEQAGRYQVLDAERRRMTDVRRGLHIRRLTLHRELEQLEAAIEAALAAEAADGEAAAADSVDGSTGDE